MSGLAVTRIAPTSVIAPAAGATGSARPDERGPVEDISVAVAPMSPSVVGTLAMANVPSVPVVARYGEAAGWNAPGGITSAGVPLYSFLTDSCTSRSLVPN